MTVLGSGAFRRWLKSHEWDYGPYKKDPESPLFFLQNLETEKIATNEPGGGLSAETESASHFIFDL